MCRLFCHKRSLAKSVLVWLRSQSGVRSARINYDCASLVLEFDPAYEDLFRLLLGRLRLMTLDDLIKMGAREVGRHEAKELLAEKAVKTSSYPLALPTVAFGLAFAANPLLRAVNIPLMLLNAYPIAVRARRVWRRKAVSTWTSSILSAIGASLIHGNQVAGALITWLIKLGDGIRDLTAAGSRRAIGELLEFQKQNGHGWFGTGASSRSRPKRSR